MLVRSPPSDEPANRRAGQATPKNANGKVGAAEVSDCGPDASATESEPSDSLFASKLRRLCGPLATELFLSPKTWLQDGLSDRVNLRLFHVTNLSVCGLMDELSSGAAVRLERLARRF
jgi:hypothetical protein